MMIKNKEADYSMLRGLAINLKVEEHSGECENTEGSFRSPYNPHTKIHGLLT